LGDTLVLKPVPDAIGYEMYRKHADTIVQLFFLERFAFMPYVSDSVGIHIAMKKETPHEDPDGAYPRTINSATPAARLVSGLGHLRPISFCEMQASS
jgi:hypothetical protein